MNKNQKRIPEFGQQITTKWLSVVPKWLRFLLIFGGLILLGYFVNKGLWF